MKSSQVGYSIWLDIGNGLEGTAISTLSICGAIRAKDGEIMLQNNSTKRPKEKTFCIITGDRVWIKKL